MNFTQAGPVKIAPACKDSRMGKMEQEVVGTHAHTDTTVRMAADHLQQPCWSRNKMQPDAMDIGEQAYGEERCRDLSNCTVLLSGLAKRKGTASWLL